jgi:hypothetical protein
MRKGEVTVDTRKTWRVFLVQLEFARHYPVAYQLTSLGAAVRNPVLETVLPSLLHIKLMAILDDALAGYLDASSRRLPARYREDLNGRIGFCTDVGLILNGQALHGARDRRNGAAHEVFSSVSWGLLDQDLNEVHAALQHLGLVSKRPDFHVEAERSALRQSDEPGILGKRDYTVRVLEGANCAGEFTWSETLHDAPAG